MQSFWVLGTGCLAIGILKTKSPEPSTKNQEPRTKNLIIDSKNHKSPIYILSSNIDMPEAMPEAGKQLKNSDTIN